MAQLCLLLCLSWKCFNGWGLQDVSQGWKIWYSLLFNWQVYFAFVEKIRVISSQTFRAKSFVCFSAVFTSNRFSICWIKYPGASLSHRRAFICFENLLKLLIGLQKTFDLSVKNIQLDFKFCYESKNIFCCFWETFNFRH